MNKQNLYKRIVVLLAMLGAMWAVWTWDADFYRGVMSGIAGWQIGTWFGTWSGRRWPIRG